MVGVVFMLASKRATTTSTQRNLHIRFLPPFVQSDLPSTEFLLYAQCKELQKKTPMIVSVSRRSEQSVPFVTFVIGLTVTNEKARCVEFR